MAITANYAIIDFLYSFYPKNVKKSETCPMIILREPAD